MVIKNLNKNDDINTQSAHTPHPVTLGRSETKTRGARISQSGRSMVEMLGVLAIVGVLSIGGIAGYSYGMDKYRANETINEVMLRGMDLITQSQTNDVPNITAQWGTHGTYYPIGLIWDDGEKQYGIVVDNVPSNVCEMMGGELKSMATVYVDNEDFEVNPNACHSSDEKSMEFYFKAISALELECKTDADCSSEETCINGLCSIKGAMVYSDYRGENTACETNEDCGPCAQCGAPYDNNCLAFKNGTLCVINGKEGQCMWGECFQKGCDENTPCKGRNEYCASPNNSCEERFVGDEQGACVLAEFQKHDVNGTTYYISTVEMSWWDAESACQAIGKTMIDAQDLLSDWNNTQAYNGQTDFTPNENMKKIYEMAIKGGVWDYPNAWVRDEYSPCTPYRIMMGSGFVNTYDGRNRPYSIAVCK